MDYEAMDDPPSYYDSLTSHKTVSTLALEQVDSFFREQPLPPIINYFVRSNRAPSAWKLLSGPCLSNATTEINTEPLRKRRYKVLYPPGYEDVFLHKSIWMSNADSLPRYFVELHGRNRYEPEPIAIMGPCDQDEDATDEVKEIAAAYVPRVCSRIEDEVSKTTRYATFCEMEYFSWDWRCKTENARQDMRHLIDKGKERCVVSEGLVLQLEKFLAFVDKQGIYPEVIRILRKLVAGANMRLERLRL
ncbi:hypothetical protein PRZ48_006042 [Zasmidium cellare]|uniref:Uncharacterized protein n=1 Tax=Zasmidium cellare TaxID=395010 RepID=A0ABR0EMW7_ZASCE|nr:hypothetical protein PRZ48_006042 [Zasmidium cellare]